MNKELKRKICVYGSPHTEYVGGLDLLNLGKELGREIADHDAILTIPATSGLPLWAAMGAKEKGGLVIGFSPAANEREHREVYRLPTEHMDVIIYSGFGHAGNDLQISRASDAVIFGAGRLDSIHEFAISFHENKPIGILKGRWWLEDILHDVIKDNEERDHDEIIIDEDPKRLIEQLLKQIKKKTL